MKTLAVALRTTLVLLVLTCAIYPALVWAIGQVAFPDQANGSLLTHGSSLIGQEFKSDRYFHGRTHSASGVDPHITPADAFAQIARVAKARNLDEARVRELVQHRIEGRFLGIYGEPRVNVLLINLDLDASRSR